MFLDDRLNMTIKEIERSDMLDEANYTESQLLDILMKNPKKEKELSKNKVYAKLIKRFKEGGLI
jgi:hypothetical protein